MQKLIQLQDDRQACESAQQATLESESLLPSGSLQHLKRKQTVTTLIMTASIVLIALILAVTLHLSFQLSRVSQQLKIAQQDGSGGLVPVLTNGDNNGSRLERFPLLVRNCITLTRATTLMIRSSKPESTHTADR